MSDPAVPISTRSIAEHPDSVSIYGESDREVAGLIGGIAEHGILVPLVVAPGEAGGADWQLVSGHRRLACARALGIDPVPCVVRLDLADPSSRRLAVIEYNRQRHKTFSQKMREADALESLLAGRARERSTANLRRGVDPAGSADRRNSDVRNGRTDSSIAEAIGLGAKDLYRQARALWKVASSGDVRALSGVEQVDRGTKSIHSAYKDLRRRDRFTAGFRPTPYDVWPFKHDRAFGIPHPGSIPPAIVAHAVHYFTPPGGLVVDPMAGGGTTLDVALAMGRRCLALDIRPTRPDIGRRDVLDGLPPEANGANLVFCDPPYHTMLSAAYDEGNVANNSVVGWTDFLKRLSKGAFAALRPGGRLAVLVANQTEKDLPAGFGYLDHAFLAYQAMGEAGFLPDRRISCPMDGAYLPQHVRQARLDGRMLGQVRDLVVGRKPMA